MIVVGNNRHDLARPVICASSSNEPGAFSAIVRKSSRLPAESTLANDSVEVNQTLGSPGTARCSPHAIRMVRAFISP